ncbi:MAG: bifunctional phosphoribosylaminoimidazolecarboxamide formyltransferase/IMP cyclohydrolase [Chitinophagales bacterium]
MTDRKIHSALISVYNKEGLEPIVKKLHELGVQFISTGGTEAFIRSLNILVTTVEQVTGFPEILGGRVKTLQPKIFGGILARRSLPEDVNQMREHEIPEIDLVIVDLYPFEETLASTDDEDDIIEKIDIGGVSLIRAAAKNFNDVLVCASRNDYEELSKLLSEKKGVTSKEDRQLFAAKAFNLISNYDAAIFNYFNHEGKVKAFHQSILQSRSLRYGENPHQHGIFYGDFDAMFNQLHGKEISYNNLVDIDAAVKLIDEFENPACAVIKHTNACGCAEAGTLIHAWERALAGDPVSAYGGIIVFNREVDKTAAEKINAIFFEVIIAPGYNDEALNILKKKKNRIIISRKSEIGNLKFFKSILNAVIEQDADTQLSSEKSWKVVTSVSPSVDQISDLLFAEICVKHLKSNAIALVKNKQLIGMGCGQTSRVDALKQAVIKAKAFGFDLNGSVLASDAFFPFNDCVQLANEAGVKAILQPGGSVRDQDSIDACNQFGIAMVFTGIRHFLH